MSAHGKCAGVWCTGPSAGSPRTVPARRQADRPPWDDGPASRVLWMIEGGKGLRKALGDVFGAAARVRIENLIGTLRHVTRNIKRWRDGDMRRRWIGLGLLRR
jgi:hypothetical protein